MKRHKILHILITACCVITGTYMYGQAFYSNSLPFKSDILSITWPYESIPDSFNKILVSIPDDFNGSLELNSILIESDSLYASVSNGEREIVLEPIKTENIHKWILYSDEPLNTEKWSLRIPSGFFKINPNMEEVENIEFDDEVLKGLTLGGAWHSKGIPSNRLAMFTVQDDDGITGSSYEKYKTEGYFTRLYPVLESLGLRGTISLEGRKAGFTDNPPTLNSIGKIAKRMQDERGWEVQSHSMQCAGEILNCWYVDDLESQLAAQLLKDGVNSGAYDYNTVSVYDGITKKQYMPDANSEHWVEVDPVMVKPYVGDFSTKRAVFYDESFDVDYHWGEWFRLADEFGIDGKSWVAHNTITSHALTPKINKICPRGFADNTLVAYNLPPLMSTVTRCNLEGQQLPGYRGSEDSDNTYDYEQLEFFRSQMEEAYEKGGWIVFALHAYRKCWKNQLPGALVSEGGSYPDSWVSPMSGVDALEDSMTPPANLGITDWSEWHPCPGTRLYMLWELLKDARDKGMMCVTSSEGYDIIGNKVSEGYYTNGIKIGQNEHNILGTSNIYPHYVVSADGEKSYYNPIYSEEIVMNDISSDTGVYVPAELLQINGKSFSIDGGIENGKSLDELPNGIWIVNGQKHLIRR